MFGIPAIHLVNSKSEYRNAKQISISNDRNSKHRIERFIFGALNLFRIWACDGLRLRRNLSASSGRAPRSSRRVDFVLRISYDYWTHRSTLSLALSILPTPIIGNGVLMGINPVFIGLLVVVHFSRGIDNDRLILANALPSVVNPLRNLNQDRVVLPDK